MEQEAEIRLAPYARAVWRRRWLIVITTVAALGAGLLAATLDDSESVPEMRFISVTTIRIEDQPAADPTDALSALQLFTGEGTQSVQTHVEVMRSSAVMSRAVTRILQDAGAPPIEDPTLLNSAARALADDVNVSEVSGSNLIAVSTIADTDVEARRRTESVVLAYQQSLREQRLSATQDAIVAIDTRIEESAQPELTSTRLKLVTDQLSRSELDRLEQGIEGSLEQIQALDLSQFAGPPSVAGTLSELEAASARLQTASIGLTSLESEIERSGGALSAVPGQNAAGSAQVLTSTSLDTVRRVGAAFQSTSLLDVLVSGLSDLNAANTSLDEASSRLRVLSNNTSITATDRTQLSRLDDQVRAVHGSNSTIFNQISTDVEAGAATESDRPRLLTQMRAASSTLVIISGTLGTLRETQTSTSALTQMVTVEGRLQSVIQDFNGAAARISASLDGGPTADLERLETLLENSLEKLNGIQSSLSPGAGGSEILVAELNSTATLLGTAGELATTLSTQPLLRALPSSGELLSIEPELNTAADLLTGIGANLASGTSLTNQILLDRIRDTNATVSTGLITSSTTRTELQAIDTENPIDSSLQAIDRASADLGEVAVAVRAAGQVMDSTAAAGVSGQLESRLLRVSNDLQSAATIFTDTASQLAGTSSTIRSMPAVMVTAAIGHLNSAGAGLVGARTTVDELRQRTASGELLMLSDADELAARLQVVQASVANATASVLTVQSAELGLAAQNLRAAETRLGGIAGQLADIDASQTAELEDLFDVRRELQIAVLGPQEIGVSLVDTEVQESNSGGGSSLPVDVRALVGAVAGFMLGTIGAVVLEVLDRKVRRAEDIPGLVRLPSLGLLPLGIAKGNPHPPEVTDDPTSVFSEAVHLVTTQVQGRVSGDSRLLLVTSPSPREGKTMMAINLARALSLRSLKVLLVDANFRKPDASKIFELEDRPGLATALTQGIDPAQFIRTLEADSLDVLPAGKSLVPPVELLSRPSTRDLLERARQRYDFVIVDGPPMLGFAESNSLAKHSGAVIVVARSGVTKKADLQEATENLTGSEVLGVVMNFVKPGDLSFLEHKDYSERASSRRWVPHVPGNIRLPRNFPFSRN